MLTFDSRTCTLEHLALRTERHGDDSAQAADLRLSFEAANDVLDELQPGLKAALYRAPDPTDAHELFETPDHLPLLRFVALTSFRWDIEVAGRTVRIAWGLGGKSDIVLADCKINKVSFVTMMGGTVHFTFRIQCHPEASDVAKLFSLLDGEVDVTADLSPAPESLLEKEAA